MTLPVPSMSINGAWLVHVVQECLSPHLVAGGPGDGLKKAKNIFIPSEVPHVNVVDGCMFLVGLVTGELSSDRHFGQILPQRRSQSTHQTIHHIRRTIRLDHHQNTTT
ncbi:hypothetical protein B0T16DRAFT_388715 [Cercophora newfieldiana]|uniref:Uncharacterized protein n=1 Tax=Cercophora newfieldiana TaxID=92897 RepID=A0AA39Y9F2_9PEZI|nr:hypothetical protein B0T16DRAFT_388715 [Cercophora newfieldiana]